MKLVWINDRREDLDFEAIVLSPCVCGAAPAKRCVGGGAGEVLESGKHPGFKWADVHEDRLEMQGALL